MTILKLALRNVKTGINHYLSLILSLAFTVLVLFNFQNMIYSSTFAVLGTQNKEYIELLIQMVSFVLGCFMFFFIWYSTNVFLTRRKKEIGIYVFMGLSNDRIAKLYFLETVFAGLSALILGLLLGVLSCGLFQMILLAISDLTVEIRFRPAGKPAAVTAGIYGAIYLLFAVKGYLQIVRSNVLTMLSAARQNEYVRQKQRTLLIKAVFGVIVLFYGYFLAVKEDRTGKLGNAFLAVILVTAGVYLLFGGLLPLLFQAAARNKRFLYQNQRILWINSMVFRMKKNYRTYAMVCVLLLCSVTALATSFAMKSRYDNIIQFEQTYTFQLLTPRADLKEQAAAVIESQAELAVSSQIPILCIDNSVMNSGEYRVNYAVLSYRYLQKLAQETGMELPFAKPGEDQVIKLSRLYLLSMITDRTEITVQINGKIYPQIDDSTVPYMGYLQELMSFYLVSDQTYEELCPLGEEVYACNYRIASPDDFEAAKAALDQFIQTLPEKDTTSRVAIDPKNNDLDWIKVMYSMCIFMFLVFVLASGSIMFMKIYNDAFEEKERMKVMLSMGIDHTALQRSVRAELAATYGIPFVVMGISSCFSVDALAKMMYTRLTGVNLVSVAVVLLILGVWYAVSVYVYEKNACLACL